jgi:hypothetical protein
MAGKVLDLSHMIEPDALGTTIANQWRTWDLLMEGKRKEQTELRNYLYATDTTTTQNKDLPWKNSTTVPKLTQLSDNLIANYMATMFPRKSWLVWEGDRNEDEAREKRFTIESYMRYVVSQPRFKKTIRSLLVDYVHWGNAFAGADWADERVSEGDVEQQGYVGPIARQYSPLDIRFNPTAPSFLQSPKIIRSIISMGEVKELLQRNTLTAEDKEEADALFEYLRKFREAAFEHTGSLKELDEYYDNDGFGSYRQYLSSSFVEVLTFLGDLYDPVADVFYKNRVIQVVDRHKVIVNKPNPSNFGYPPIWHSGWRQRPENLWAMGPLDNLVGMQYRIDHLENLKADVWDMTAFPLIKIKGYVEDFDYAPAARIYAGDEGDVELLAPDVGALQANLEIQQLSDTMEQMAGAPREALGFRTPGEKTAYEVERLENASARIFQSKVTQFEEEILEPLLNGMLELARRNLDEQTIRVIDEEHKITEFLSLTGADLVGTGRLRPVASQHFAEKATILQNLNNLFQSAVGQDPAVNQHFSGEQMARMLEELLELENFNIVTPYIRIQEASEAERLIAAEREQTMGDIETPTGLTPDDVDEEVI